MLGTQSWTRFSVGVAAGLLLAVAPVTAAAAGGVPTPTPPHIVAHPRNVMVNTTITLTGTGFPANSTVDLSECGATRWSVPQNPCDSNDVSVQTDAHGAFVTTFTMALCPRTPPKHGPVTKEKCYVGERHPYGVDGVMLIGAAKVKVTYP